MYIISRNYHEENHAQSIMNKNRDSYNFQLIQITINNIQNQQKEK